MAEGKVIGKLTNIVNFSTDKASLNKVLADIKKVKDAMKGVTQPFAKVQQQMTRANKQQARMKSDYLVVQKQLDKTEKSQLKTAEAIYKAKNKQALAEQKIANQRRAQSVRGLTAKSGAGKASGTLFADMLRGEAKQDAASLRRQREINKAHTQAIIEDRKRSLNDQKQFSKMWDKEMNRIYNERRDDVLKRHNNARKERRARWKQEARDLKEMNRLHGQALAENMKRDQKIQNLYDRRRQAVLSARSSATAKRIARREREQSRASREQGSINNRNMRMDRRAQATQEWFGSTFGRGGQRKAASLYGDLRSGKINAEQYSTRLRSLRADLYRTQRAQRGFNQSIHDMRGAFIQATASYTAFAGVMGIANIGKQYEAQKAQMLVATGSKEQAASQLDYLRSETYRLGLGREQASQGYTQIAMAGQADIGVEGVNRLFTGLSELSTAVQLTPFKYEKVVNSLSQMLS